MQLHPHRDARRRLVHKKELHAADLHVYRVIYSHNLIPPCTYMRSRHGFGYSVIDAKVVDNKDITGLPRVNISYRLNDHMELAPRYLHNIHSKWYLRYVSHVLFVGVFSWETFWDCWEWTVDVRRPPPLPPQHLPITLMIVRAKTSPSSIVWKWMYSITSSQTYEYTVFNFMNF